MSESSLLKFPALFDEVQTVLSHDIARLLEHARLPTPLAEACAYALAGGKRVRPLLVAGAWASVVARHVSASEGETTPPVANPLCLPSSVRRAMLAVECLHAYSLIHDDLPCMDDDALRRGQPTCHIQFDEATALLAGDVLQTLAFEALIAQIEDFADLEPPLAHALLTTFAPRARRMVAGQMQDLMAENKAINQPQLEAIHQNKTGALIEAAVLLGGLCAKANEQQLACLEQFGANVGLAFQVQDDVLDVTADTHTLGKQAGSDDRLNKSTYVKLLGVDDAKHYAEQLMQQSIDDISHEFGTQAILLNIGNWLWQRQH